MNQVKQMKLLSFYKLVVTLVNEVNPMKIVNYSITSLVDLSLKAQNCEEKKHF